MNKITTSFTAKLRNLSLTALVAVGLCANAQDVHFSQFYEAPLEMNPSMCGAFPGKIYGELNYRSQWSSVMGGGLGFNTMAATFEYHNILKHWDKGYLAPGLDFYNDKSGDAKIGITQANFTLASGIFLNDKNSISVGLQSGWAQHSISTNSLKWDNQYINGAYDASASSGEPNIGNSFSYIDFAAGIMYSFGTGQTNMTSNDAIKANIGGAVYHVSQPEMSYYGKSGPGTKLYMRYVAHGQLQYGIQNSNITVIPGFIYYQQGPAQEINVGCKFRYIIKQESKYTGISKGSAVDLGGYYRFKDAAVVLVGLEFGSYALGVSYDVNTSSLTSASNSKGGFEISLRLINPNPFMGNTNSGTTTKSMF